MESPDELRESIEAQLSRPLGRPHFAAALAYDIVELLARCGNGAEPDGAQYRSRFLDSLQREGITDLVGEQVAYALRLASYDGDLGYEEMHKLFSLCDEIEALRALGLMFSDGDRRALMSALEQRFGREPRKARLVAEDRWEEWKREWWWYAVNVSARKRSGAQE